MMGDDDRTRHEGADPAATRHEGADPEATRHEGDSAAGSPSRVRWFGQLPAGVQARFEFLRPLSTAGGQADVLLCRDLLTDEQVAVKLYRGRPQIDFPTYEKLRTISAAHVTPILDLQVDEDGTWEVQEFFPDGSLHDLLRARGGGAQSPVWVREVVRELAEALRALHSNDITHRDLKPGNVFVRCAEPLDLVVGDFGFARDLAMSAEYMSVVGVFHYAAPEVLRGLVSKAADWWSLGVITFELLTGKSLFVDPLGDREANRNAVRGALDTGTYSLGEITDERWRLLLRGLLNRSRPHRWDHTQVLAWLSGESPEVVEQLDGIASPSPVAVPPLVLPWGSFPEPAGAIATLARHWRDACDYLSGQGSTHLRLWLQQKSAGDQVDTTLRAVRDHAMSPDEGLVLLQVLLNPGDPVIFQGRRIDGESLAQVARDAIGGSADAQGWIRSLRRDQALGALASGIAAGSQLATADLRLRQHWRRLDPIIKEVAATSSLNKLLPGLEGRLEGIILAASLEPSLIGPHLGEAATVAARLTGADPELLRTWALAVRQRGVEAFPEALLLELIGRAAVEARLAIQKSVREEETRQRRAARIRELRTRLGAALVRLRKRAILSLVLVVALGLLEANLGILESWASLWPALGLPLLLSLVCAFLADVLMPSERRTPAPYALGAALLAWQIFWTFPTRVDGVSASLLHLPVGLAPWFALGYAAAHLAGTGLRRFEGRNAGPVLHRYRVLPWLSVATVVVLSVLTKFDLTLVQLVPPDLYWQLSESLIIPGFRSLPGALMSPVSGVVASSSLVLLSFADRTSSLGRVSQRIVWGALNGGALLVILHHLPELVLGGGVVAVFLLLTVVLSGWASWVSNL